MCLNVYVNLGLYENPDAFQTCAFPKKKRKGKKEVWARMLKSTLSGRLWERKGKKFLISFVTRMHANQSSHCEGYFQGGLIIMQIIGQGAIPVSRMTSGEHDR